LHQRPLRKWMALIPMIVQWCIGIGLPRAAYCMDPNRAMSQYVRERWNADRGFPRGPVYAFSQSADGYLWIGTKAGLVRFDGLNFRLMRNTPGLPNGASVLGLVADRGGSMWIRLEGSLLVYRNGLFQNTGVLLHASSSAMCISKEGQLIISGAPGGIIESRAGRFETIVEPRDLPGSPVLSLAPTVDGSLWFGTRGAGLFRQLGGHVSAISQGVPDAKVNSLLAGPDGDLLIGTDNGIARWNGSRMAPESESLRNIQVLALERDRDGNIWAGTDSRGLIRINALGSSQPEKTGEESPDAVTALFEDREANLWTGSAAGVERLRDSAFVTYSMPEGLPTDGSNPIYIDEERRLWFGPVAGGLWWAKEGQHGAVSQDGLERDVVYSIAGGARELWLGRQRGGLTRLGITGGRLSAKTYTKADGLAQNSVFSVYRARDGSIWAGTLSGGVSRFRDGRFTTYTRAAGLLSNTVTAILEAPDESMWFATPAGLSQLARTGWHSYTAKDGLPSENIYCLLEDSTGVLWIGTAAGLAFRNAGVIRHVAGSPEWLREPILGLAEDRQGSLWVATSTHVLRVNRDKLLQGALSEGDWREYGSRTVCAEPRVCGAINLWFRMLRDGSGFR
jgi:ligand-binding sensor domain-containing protein